jgi:predicted RNA binding protein YcfA (HicA-like mRNA interferase family)
MPRKVRELRADLRRAGFVLANTEGSHQTWRHPSGQRVILAGRDGADAQRYQERQVRGAINDAEAATRATNAEKGEA